MKAPFPYFGGKSKIAPLVWQALGDVKAYLEPFFGSGAVLLNRSDYRPSEHIETICGADGFVANSWRALQADPDAVAKVCDHPVNHADLCARKRRMLAEKEGLLEKLIAGETYYDAKLAGYWIWAASCWIGSGLTHPNQIPNIGGGGSGVHALGQRPNVGGGDGDVKDVRDPYNTNLWVWFRQLSERLRYVRVVCGDWTRICGGDWQDHCGVVGIFFDPPYSHDVERDVDIYDQESPDVAKAVAEWAAERGDRKTYRIVLAGYEGEHDWLEGRGWRVIAWKAHGGYSTLTGQASENRHRERLWLSPHCVRMRKNPQQFLFG